MHRTCLNWDETAVRTTLVFSHLWIQSHWSLHNYFVFSLNLGSILYIFWMPLQKYPRLVRWKVRKRKILQHKQQRHLFVDIVRAVPRVTGTYEEGLGEERGYFFWRTRNLPTDHLSCRPDENYVTCPQRHKSLMGRVRFHPWDWAPSKFLHWDGSGALRNDYYSYSEVLRSGWREHWCLLDH